MSQGGLILAAGRVCVQSERNENKKTNFRRTQKTPHPQQPGDRDHLETACDEIHPMRWPIFRVKSIGLAATVVLSYPQSYSSFRQLVNPNWPFLVPEASLVKLVSPSTPLIEIPL